MSRVREHDPKSAVPVLLALPPIALNELKEPTKDFLLAKANAGATPLETMKELLDRGAERAGFRARRAAASRASQAAEAWTAAGNFEVQVGAGAGAGFESHAPAPQSKSNCNNNPSPQQGGDES